ncbi:MAG: ATP-binding protein [Desulfovibrionales bacterium]
MKKDCDELFQELERTRRYLAFIRTITGILTGPELSLEEKLSRSLRLILGEILARTGSIMLLSDDGTELRVVAATREDLIDRVQLLRPDSVSGYVCRTKAPLLVEDMAMDERFPSRANYATASFLSVPMLSVADNRLIGVINASDRDQGGAFTPENMETVLSYASWVGPLLENSCLVARLENEKDRYMEIAEELSLKQKEILIASTERSELVEMVVHDFKSPLSAVITNLDLLRFIGLAEDQEPIVETALGGARKLLDMINNFLEIARLDHFQTEGNQLKVVDVNPVLEDLLEDLRPLFKQKSLRLTLLNPSPVRVLGDDSLLHHLFQNLLSNALKYTPPHGEVRIGWETASSHRRGDETSKLVHFFVEDTGIGISDELKATLFRKFRRGNRSADAGVDGSGIGLFICQKILTILKGRIWIEDVHPRGTRFCFTLFSPDKNG